MPRHTMLDEQANAVPVAIARIFRDALTCRTEEDLGRTCLSVAEALTQSRFGFIGEINRETGKLDGIAISDRGWEACRIPNLTDNGERPPVRFEIHGIYGRVLLDGRSLIANDPAHHPDRVGLPAGHPPLRAFLGVPLIHAGETLGIMGLGNRDGGYGAYEMEAAEGLAPAIVQAFMGKRAEMALRDSEQRLRLALDAACLISFEWDIQRDRVWHDGPSESVLGPTALDALDTFAKVLDMVHPQDRERFGANVQAALERADGRYRSELRLLTPDGRVVWLSEFGRVERDARGRPARLVGLSQDVTARKTAEAERERLLAERTAVMQATDVMLALLDADFNFVWVNPAYAETCRMQPEEMVGKNHFALYPHSENEAIFRRVRDTGEGVFYKDKPFEFPDQPERGVTYWDWSLAPIKAADSGVSGLVLSLRETTRYKRAEDALREADRRKDAFLATLGHELRNPLAPIRNACAVLKLVGAADPAVSAARDLIDRQVSHLVRLVDDLLDVSRITRGKLALQRERVALAAVLERALEVVRPAIDAAGQRLSVVLPPESVALEADPVRLAQVFANLLDNACKYTPKGGHIRLAVAQAGAEVAVEVSDTGLGIPAEHLPHLFELFHQVPTGPERVQSGLGIGLALVEGLVAMHGGRVSAHSGGPGTGSTFRVCLPVESSSPAAPTRPTDARPPVSIEGRVLVVDDQADVADSLALLLRLHGIDVQIARDGLEGLALAERFRPDLVLLDLGMPQLDGFETCRQLRARPWGRDLSIVAVTGWGQEGDRERSAAAGFDAHWIKPVAPEAVLDRLASGRARRRP